MTQDLGEEELEARLQAGSRDNEEQEEEETEEELTREHDEERTSEPEEAVELTVAGTEGGAPPEGEVGVTSGDEYGETVYEVSGHEGITLMEAMRQELCPRLGLVVWNDFQVWRVKSGMKPTAIKDGFVPKQKVEHGLYVRTMSEIFWGLVASPAKRGA